MKFKRLGITALQVVGLGLLPSAALAENITDTTTFTGVVPGVCTFGSGTSQTVTLEYGTSNGGTFTGRSGNIAIDCNYVANFTLGAVTANGANPSQTSNTASIFNGTGTSAIVTSGGSASAQTSLGNTANQTFNAQIGLTATGASGVGTYSYTVVLTVLSS